MLIIQGMEFTGEKDFFTIIIFRVFFGEVAPLRGPGREIGHGALAERAITPLIPDKEIFLYYSGSKRSFIF